MLHESELLSVTIKSHGYVEMISITIGHVAHCMEMYVLMPTSWPSLDIVEVFGDASSVSIL